MPRSLVTSLFVPDTRTWYFISRPIILISGIFQYIYISNFRIYPTYTFYHACIIQSSIHQSILEHYTRIESLLSITVVFKFTQRIMCIAPATTTTVTFCN